MPTKASTARVRNQCITRWRRALWHNGSSCGAEIALTLRRRWESSSFSSYEPLSMATKSNSMAEALAVKWQRMKSRSFIRLPPGADSLCQHCLRANFLVHLVHHPSLKHHPSLLRHGRELVGGRRRPVRHTQPALLTSTCTMTS